MIWGVYGPGLMGVSMEITAKDAKDSMATPHEHWLPNSVADSLSHLHMFADQLLTHIHRMLGMQQDNG